MIFHGNGRESFVEVLDILTRLKEGHIELSGLQQGIDVDSDEYEEGMDKIKQVCIEILASFGFSDEGLKWKKLNYPEDYRKLKAMWDLKRKQK